MNKKLIFIILAFSVLLFAILFLIQSPSVPDSVKHDGVSLSKERDKAQSYEPAGTPIPVEPSRVSESTPAPVQPEPVQEPTFEVSSEAAPLSAADLVVPPGARVPAILMDAGSPQDGVPINNIISGIIDEFVETINEAKRTNQNMQEAWEEARQTADERYRLFFGDDAYNGATLEAAIEANEEAAPTDSSPVRN